MGVRQRRGKCQFEQNRFYIDVYLNEHGIQATKKQSHLQACENVASTYVFKTRKTGLFQESE